MLEKNTSWGVRVKKENGQTEIVIRESGGGGISYPVPALFTRSTKSAKRFIEFFTANIRNLNTRAAYVRAVMAFTTWCEAHQLDDLDLIEPVHVASYIEGLTKTHAKPTVKQHLAAIRMLFDWLVVGQIVAINPASVVRGPKHSVKKGKTPVLSGEDARALIDSIDTSTIVGLRDRAIIGVMVYTFARVSAVIGMKVEDFYPNGKRTYVRLHEKGGKYHEMPCNHNLEEYLEAYVKAAGLAEHPKTPLFRSSPGHSGVLTELSMGRQDVYAMIRRRALQAAIRTRIGCHTFRATGITQYLKNGGKLEIAQRMAAHESARTTGLYDRRDDEIHLDEVERILI